MTPQEEVDAFNSVHPVGTMVNYWRGPRRGLPSSGRTVEPACLLLHKTPVVWIDSSDCQLLLTHVEVVPEQPDGIEEEGREVPDPITAAKRVVEYIKATGDGLYDVSDGAPLYGRDLEAICRAVLKP